MMRRAAAVVVPLRRRRATTGEVNGHHAGRADCRSGRTAATSCCRQEVFDHLPENGDLVADACGALAEEGRLFGYQHDGFWKPADTFKERAELEAGLPAGHRPWMVWEPRRQLAVP